MIKYIKWWCQYMVIGATSAQIVILIFAPHSRPICVSAGATLSFFLCAVIFGSQPIKQS
jgi:hypothetical protein